tara:strand:- start:39 stop:239 length:201 start_codon:yes stop_codon:yes gene_type:complete
MENITAAYTNIVVPENEPKIKENKKGLLYSNKRMGANKKVKTEEPLDRVQRYVGEIRKKRMEIKNV